MKNYGVVEKKETRIWVWVWIEELNGEKNVAIEHVKLKSQLQKFSRYSYMHFIKTCFVSFCCHYARTALNFYQVLHVIERERMSEKKKKFGMSVIISKRPKRMSAKKKMWIWCVFSVSVWLLCRILYMRVSVCVIVCAHESSKHEPESFATEIVLLLESMCVFFVYILVIQFIDIRTTTYVYL